MKQGTAQTSRTGSTKVEPRSTGINPAAVADKLQKLNVKIIPNEDCKILVKREYEEVVKRNLSYEDVARSSSMGVSETQICGLSKNNTSVCYVSYSTKIFHKK